MSKAKKVMGIAVVVLGVITAAGIYLSRVNIPVLEPKGPIADKEFRLMLLVTGLMLIVVIPVFILLAFVSIHYNENNQKRGRYTPNWDHSRFYESLWWLIPSALIAVLSVITWNSSYALNPYKPLVSKNPTLNVQVVALDWKWLFIYPNQHLASVNQVVFPVNTPVHFYITADAPMNSFWIPQLSGQIYAMAGMQTQLYLMANTIGSFNGWSANISGAGFASMMFQAKSTTNAGFRSWAKSAAQSSPALTLAAYDRLDLPSSYVPEKHYSNPAPNLFNDIMDQYMLPGNILRTSV